MDNLCPRCGTSFPLDLRGLDLFDDGLRDADSRLEITDSFVDAEDTDPGAAPALAYEAEDTVNDPVPEVNEQSHSPIARIDLGLCQEGRNNDGHRSSPEERQKTRLPWGRLLFVLAYLALGGSLLLYEYQTSDWTNIDRHLGAADALLGERMGAATSVDDLIEAAEHYLQALLIDPHLEIAHRRLDLVKRRLEDQRRSLPDNLEKRHIALSSRSQLEKAQQRKGFFADFPITPGERFGLSDHRKRLRRNSYAFFGGLALVLGWMALSSSLRKLSSRETRGPNDPDADDSPGSKTPRR